MVNYLKVMNKRLKLNNEKAKSGEYIVHVAKSNWLIAKDIVKSAKYINPKY